MGGREIKESIMAEKKAILLLAPELNLNAASEALDKLRKKAALLPIACKDGLEARAAALGAKTVDTSALTEQNEEAFLLLKGGETELAAILEYADRRTLVVVAGADAVAFYGLAVNGKAGAVERAVSAEDIALTIATIADLPITAECTGGIVYQVMKNPNLKLDEIRKLKEALLRMESVIQRDNREPWDKHDCA